MYAHAYACLFMLVYAFGYVYACANENVQISLVASVCVICTYAMLFEWNIVELCTCICVCRHSINTHVQSYTCLCISLFPT